MRLKKPHLSLALTLFALSQTNAFAITEVSKTSVSQEVEKSFSASWPTERPPGKTLEVIFSSTSHCGGGKSPPLQFYHWIRNYLEPQSLSSHANATVLLDPRNENWRNWHKTLPINCSSADMFYIEQAIWEATPFAKSDKPDQPGKYLLRNEKDSEQKPHLRNSRRISAYDPTLIAGRGNGNSDVQIRRASLEQGELCWNFSCKDLYFEEHPEVAKNHVVLHFIPLNTAQCFPNAIEQRELHDAKNLKAINIGKLKSAEFEDFRDEWLQFIQSNVSKKSSNPITRKVILEEADRLAEKYRSLFAE